MKKIIILLILTLLLISCNNKSTQKEKQEARLSIEEVKEISAKGNEAFNCGEFQVAIEHLSKVLQNGTWEKDSTLYFETKLDLACSYNRFQNSDKAFSYAYEALEGFKRHNDTLEIGTTLTTISAFYGEKLDFEKAKSLALEGMKYIISQNDSVIICLAYNQVAFNYTDQEDYENGILYLDTALTYLKNENFKEHASSIFINLSDSYISLGKFDTGIDYLEKALALTKSNKQKFLQQLIYSKLSEVYEQKKEFKKSLDFLYESITIKEELFSEEKSEALASMEVRYKTQEKEEEIKSLKLEQKLLKTKRNYIIIILSISLFLLLSLVYIVYIKLKKAKESLFEKDNELKNYFQLLLQKNQECNKLLDQQNAQFQIVSIEEKIAQDNDESLELINTKIVTNDDWEFFKKRFSLIHKGLIQKLRMQYSDISAAEERLFLLIRINMKTSEIALSLGISEDSVKKTRQRLRKRLNIESNENLDIFIQNFH